MRAHAKALQYFFVGRPSPGELNEHFVNSTKLVASIFLFSSRGGEYRSQPNSGKNWNSITFKQDHFSAHRIAHQD